MTGISCLQSVTHAGGGSVAVAVLNQDASPAITRVTISSSGASLVNIGVANLNAAPRLAGSTPQALDQHFSSAVEPGP